MPAFGATLPIVLFGLAAQLRWPLVLGADLVYGLFFYVLWRQYRPRTSTGPPPGAIAT